MNSGDPFKILDDQAAAGSLKGKFSKTWAEESFDLESAAHERWGITHTKNYLGISIAKNKLLIFSLVISLAILIVFGRIFYLQIVKGDYYRALAEGNRLRLSPIPAERGIIYDKFNRELVQNVPTFNLTIVPQDLPREQEKRDQIIERLETISEIPAKDIRNLLSKYGAYSYQSIVLKENLDYQTALKLYIQNSDLPGALIESGTKRKYLTENSNSTSTLSLSHLLGYLSKVTDDDLSGPDNKYLPTDYLGKTGLEKYYEPILRGSYGRKKIEVNALGKEQNILAVEPPTPGKNLILSLDLEAQNALEKIVKAASKVADKPKIAAIALNPQNGEILALVSWPTYNNNFSPDKTKGNAFQQYLDDPDLPLFNRSISGVYPSGSIIKLVVAAAALQEKVITESTSVNSTGGLQISRWFFKDWKAGGHGITNVTKALAWSVNTFFYYIGGGFDNFTGLGVDRMLRYFNLFNLGQKTKIDLPAENSGALPDPKAKAQTNEQWFVGDTYNLSIGQGGLLVTPLQAAVWTAAIANNGGIIQPHLAVKWIDPDQDKTEILSYPIIRQDFISPKNIQIVQKGMRECVLYGSCQLLKTLPFAAAGKTGTAQWNNDRPTHAWFTSFAPYRDPRIVVTVLVEEGGEGAAVAMPIADKFLAWWGKKYLTP